MIKSRLTFSQFHYCIPSLPATWADCKHCPMLGMPLVLCKYLLSQKVFRDQKGLGMAALKYTVSFVIATHYHIPRTVELGATLLKYMTM